MLLLVIKSMFILPNLICFKVKDIIFRWGYYVIALSFFLTATQNSSSQKTLYKYTLNFIKSGLVVTVASGSLEDQHVSLFILFTNEDTNINVSVYS